MEQSFPRSIDALDSIFQFVATYLAATGIEADQAFTVDLIIEELFTNLVKYSRGGVQPISIGLGMDGERLVIRITDFDGEPFDLTQAPAVDTSRPIAERKPGGLGIHFVRQIADELRYEHSNGASTIIVIKRLE
jgi:serine/threonine-protein kinase RsbW